MGNLLVDIRLVDIVFALRRAFLIFENSKKDRFLFPVEQLCARHLLDIFNRRFTGNADVFTLLSNCVTMLGGEVRSVEIIGLDNSYCSSKIEIKSEEKTVELYAKTSDALALAILNQVSIVATPMILTKMNRLSLLEEANLLISTEDVYSVCEHSWL